MKTGIFIFCCIWLCVAGIQAQTNAYDSIVHNGLKRTYLLHIPASYNPSQKMPLVFGFHGGGSTGWYNFEQTAHLIAKSNAAGFILVYPEGVKFLGSRTWNGGGCCGYAVKADIDDVGFINALMDTLSQAYNIDADRIYATGLSNGAIMSYRLASELSDRIAAIAPVSGTLEDSAFVCNPSRPVPIIQFHSVLDNNIYLNGGYGTGPSGHSFNPVAHGLKKFASLNGCAQGPDSTYYIAGSSFYYKKHWYGCQCGAEQVLYVTGDGGHSWPGGSTGPSQGADPPSTIMDANDSIWNFFQKHSRVCSVTSAVDEREQSTEPEVWPNPFSIQTTLQFPKPLDDAKVKIFNLCGQPVKELDHMNGSQVTLFRDRLPCGAYILQVVQGRQFITTTRLIIID